MGDVTDKFRKICNQMDGLPNYPAEWLPELYAIADRLDGKITADKAGNLRCTRNDIQIFLAQFGKFQKRYLSVKAPKNG